MQKLIQLIRKYQAGVAAAGFILVMGAVIVTMKLQDSPDARLGAIRARGYPASLTELSASYKAVPPERNAAMICTRAFALPCFPGETNSTAELSRKEWIPTRGEPLKPEDLAELEELVRLASPALELLHSVPANPEARYPLDFSAGFGMLLPHVGSFKRAMRLLEAEMLTHSAKGRIDKGVAALLAAERVRSTLEQEPIFISRLVTLACSAIIVRDLEYLLNAHRLAPDELQALKIATGTARLEGGLAQALAADRAFGIAVFEDPAQIGLMGGGPQPNALGRGVVETLRMSGVFNRDRAYYLDQMSNYVFAAEQPFPLRWQLGKQISDSLAPKKYHIISRALIPSFGRAFIRHAEGVARLRLAETALAIEGYRRNNAERLPENLQELTPKYLNSVPADPFDSNPLRYRTWQTGFVVYSLGPDQKDNGGTTLARKSRNLPTPNELPGDLCFTVGKRPEASGKAEDWFGGQSEPTASRR